MTPTLNEEFLVKRIVVGLAVIVLGFVCASADVRPANLFSDNVLLQRDIPCPVWGVADPGEKVALHFTHAGGGLVAKGGQPLNQFAITGADRKFVWADAKVVGDTVVVSNSNVPNPTVVRYAWADNPEGCNLYNKDGLPASPFRTDEW